MKLFYFLPLLLLISLSQSCSSSSNNSEEDSETVLIQIESEENQIAFTDSLYKFRVEINYPTFSSNDSNAAALLNALISQKVREYRSFEVEYRDNYDEMMAAFGNSKSIGENDLIVNYRIVDSCDRVFSLIMEVGTFYMGSAQSTFFQDCFNFDLKDMSRIYASQIFSSTEDVLIPLSAMVNEKVRKMNENQCRGLAGPEELYNFINNFSMGPHGLSFHFSDFSICPFAGTDPEIFFSWDEIRTLCKAEVIDKYCSPRES